MLAGVRCGAGAGLSEAYGRSRSEAYGLIGGIRARRGVFSEFKQDAEGYTEAEHSREVRDRVRISCEAHDGSRG